MAQRDTNKLRIRWCKHTRQFVPSPSPRPVKSPRKAVPPTTTEQNNNAPTVASLHLPPIEVVGLGADDVAKFFSVAIFQEDTMARTPLRVYVDLFARIQFSTDLARIATNRKALELFLECYELCLGLVTVPHPSLCREWLPCAEMYLFLGRFAKARRVAQQVGASKDMTERLKRVLVLSRNHERACETSRRALEFAYPPKESLHALVAAIDSVLSTSPASPEALYLKTAVLVATQMYDELLEFLTRLPFPLVASDTNLLIANARAQSHVGNLEAAVALLQKMPPGRHSPTSRQYLEQLQRMQSRRAQGISLVNGGHYTAAIDMLTTCLALETSNALYQASVLYERSGAFLGVPGREGDAVADAEACLRLQPTHALCHVRLRSARVQLETAKMQHLVYKEQRAADKANKRPSYASVFFRTGAPSNLAPRDQLRYLKSHTEATGRPKTTPVLATIPLELYYTMLGISPAASMDEVKKAYHRCALQLHPDKRKNADADDQFKAIATAYAVLSDTAARDEYDRVVKSSCYSTH
ncbi:hypothetical protein SDRG_07954 [Saprolegnia diclina VS20]|uniref:J domain-containing protein n=1 Tax=Saprolegnia diclina (strain VS20) TaxID=1156394 RepID=T0RQ39_SAPDV|nr:hypothetical protein SDRG_07954 [Saprolegnia diclina VS20]EQC34633.1 hypothetical protein SDRG_07954 [Saprolegnia diclina VS20]|eukprot:XP_008612039.1 hypothetical protein SDRG_07954 [Saprolegnia diclina VS20]